MDRNYKRDSRRLDLLMTQQEVLDVNMSTFKNLPSELLTDTPVIDVYREYCEDVIAFDEIKQNKDRYISFLISFIQFMYSDMKEQYDDFDADISKLDYVMQCHDGTFGEKWYNCRSTGERLKLASEYGWYITPNEVFGVEVTNGQVQ